MFYFLSEAVKRRLIQELRNFWASHPMYDDIVDNIQGKYSFQERPQYGIIVNTSGASHVQISADNFMGHISSYCALAKVDRYPGLSLEWIREDALQVKKNNGRFPSPAGVYYIEITEYDKTTNTGMFYVDRLLDMKDDQPTFADTKGQLLNKPLAGTAVVYEMPSGRMLTEGGAYTIDYEKGEITLSEPLRKGLYISVDYRYPGHSTGPHPFGARRADPHTIPGVVLAFGTRAQQGDRMAIIVSDRREMAYMEYGGKWDIGIDCEVISRDLYAQMEISDRTVVWIFGMLRPRLASEGIEIMDISLGGETEETYDENGDDYYYNATFSMTLETDWRIQIPMGLPFKSVSGATQDQLREAEKNPGTVSEGGVHAAMGIRVIRDPFFVGKSSNLEVIK